jgi:carboxyl-terminal processing protease
MPRLFCRSFICKLALLVAGCLGAAPQLAGDELRLTDAKTAATSAAKLEGERKWRDAIDIYKKALKSWPNEETLTYGLRRSQFQFAVERRYTDPTFVQQLRTLDRETALGLFDDVLENVQNHFVDPINTTSIVAHGTESLWLALSNERFIENNLFGVADDRLKRFRDDLRTRYWNKPVYYKDGARQTISEICALAQETIGLDAGPVVMEYVFGACNCLDDYSNVLSPGRRGDLYSNIRGQFVGIGIVLEAEPGKGMKLVQVLPESPAFESGLLAADIISSIDGTDCRTFSTDEAANLLSGTEGTQVRLVVVRNGQSINATCTRRPVKVRSIPVVRIIDQANGIAYIQMTGFQQGSVAELDAALAQLEREGMKSLIWDVRGNPGGLLPASVEILDRFIDDGVLVSTRGRNADQNFTYTAHRPGTYHMPLVLLIDGNSASASEIVAGAIRDHKRGQIVGRNSYGKWSVQSIYDIRLSCGIRVTTAKFYSPNGETLGKIGVKPDYEIPEGETYARRLGDVDAQRDPDVVKAVDLLRGSAGVTQR